MYIHCHVWLCAMRKKLLSLHLGFLSSCTRVLCGLFFFIGLLWNVFVAVAMWMEKYMLFIYCILSGNCRFEWHAAGWQEVDRAASKCWSKERPDRTAGTSSDSSARPHNGGRCWSSHWGECPRVSGDRRLSLKTYSLQAVVLCEVVTCTFNSPRELWLYAVTSRGFSKIKWFLSHPYKKGNFNVCVNLFAWSIVNALLWCRQLELFNLSN